MKRAVSSAYMEVLMLCVSPLTFLEWFSVAKSKRHRSGSMAITNKSGERGSPCRRPLPCFRGVLGDFVEQNP